MEFGQIDPTKGESMRKEQLGLSRCALLIGDERGVIGRSMLGWQAYNAALAPIPRASNPVASWGGRPVVNLIGDDLQLPPVLDAP